MWSSVFKGVAIGGGLALGIGVAVAVNLRTFSPGTPISSGDINQNFAELNAAVTALQRDLASTQSSVDGEIAAMRARLDALAGTRAALISGTSLTASRQGASPWISGITRVATGEFQVNFSFGTFAEPPVCVCGVRIPGGRFCSLSADSYSGIMLHIRDHLGVPFDDDLMLQCVGR